MIAKKFLTNSSFNQIIRNTRLITKKKTNINNLLIGHDIHHSSSLLREPPTHQGQVANINDIRQPPPVLDAIDTDIKKNVNDTISGKEKPQNQEHDPNDPNGIPGIPNIPDIPTVVDGQAPTAPESAQYQGNSEDDFVTKLPDEQNSE